MKNRLPLALLCLLSVACGRKEEPMVDIDGEAALSELKIDVSAGSVMSESAESGAWNAGDRINIWFDDHYSVDSPDLIIRYDSSSNNAGKVW